MPSKSAEILLHHLERAAQEGNFESVVDGIRQVLVAHGIVPDRLQIPMTKPTGFRHPTFFAVILTWNVDNGFEETFSVPHNYGTDPRPLAHSIEALAQDPERASTLGPFIEVLATPDRYVRIDLREETRGYELLKKFRDQGKVDYCALDLPMPGSTFPQMMSITAATSFPADLKDRLDGLKHLLGLALYGAYRASQASQVAQVYLGQTTGPKVLNGDISRGYSETMEAGIMFCDIRGFTSLSERIGMAGIVPIINRIFEIVGHEAQARNGEILKFMGDAMLIIFSLKTRDETDVARAMVETVEQVLHSIHEVAQETGEPVAVGFGCHLGEVLYGNIGTPERLDFTVMGPAVNLASRLEGLCKVIDAPAVFSPAVADHIPELQAAGTQPVKGISEPISLWVLPNP
jgi:adenylate cyclase